MAKQPRITVLQPGPDASLGRFDAWLRDAGVRVGVLGLWEKDVPQLASAGEGLLVLGGPMSVDDDRTHPWLNPLRDLLADALDIQLPILAICLGHQVLAQALGGRVVVDDPAGGERGVVAIDWTASALNDPVFGALACSGPTLVNQSHHAVVADLPPGANELARSATYPNQVFRLGSAWGVQFHPEKTPQMLARYVADTPDERLRLISELTQADDQIRPAGHLVASGFARFVRQN